MTKQQKKSPQTNSMHSRVLSKQMSKQEKRSSAFIVITQLKRQARAAVKSVRHTRFV